MTDTRWLDRRENRTWLAYNDMSRHLAQALERQFASAGLSSSDFELLTVLSRAPDQHLRARDLGRLVRWDRSRISHQLRRMEQRGLVRRENCADDARGVTVHLTDEGREALEAVQPGHVDAVRRLFLDQLTPDEMDLLATIANRVMSRIAEDPFGPGTSIYIATIHPDS